MKKIKVDDDLCIGCGICSSISESFQVVEKDGSFKSVFKDKGITEDQLIEAKERCPLLAIKIEED